MAKRLWFFAEVAMSRVLVTLAAPDSPDEVEQQFYEALRRAQIDVLMSLWAEEDDALCVHPGGPRMVGAAAIRASFEAVFANRGGLPIHAEKIHRVHTATAAVHSVLEHLELSTLEGTQSAWVMATNIYVPTPKGWRLVAHHASPADLQDINEEHSVPTVLH
jgi:ketosteroid isomerase-like protein